MGCRKRQFLVVADLRFAFANKASPPVFDHSRHDEPRQRDRSKGINLEQPPHLIRRDVQRLCRGRVGDPCVIDEDIDPTECLDRRIDNRRQVLFVAEIGCRNGRAIVTFASACGSSSGSCPLRSGTPDGQLSTRPTSSRDQDPARHLLPELHARLSGSAPRVVLQQSSRAVTEERSDNPGSSPPSEIGACSICRMPREPLTNHRFVYCCQDGGKSLLGLATQLWMSEYVEFVLADRGEGTRSHLRRVEPGL